MINNCSCILGLIQCSGEAIYSNDIFSQQSPSEELWAAFVQTTEFHEKIVKIDASKVLVGSSSSCGIN